MFWKYEKTISETQKLNMNKSIEIKLELFSKKFQVSVNDSLALEFNWKRACIHVTTAVD